MEPEQVTPTSGLPKKYIIGIVVIIIIIAGFFFLNRKIEAPIGQETEQSESANTTPKTQTPTTPTQTGINPLPGADKPSLTISYTDSGFSPASIKIKRNLKVEFVNMSSGLMWVASAPHPSHTTYPEFDEKAVSQRGEIYAFTFDKVGTWKYHNHLNPIHTATIIVE